MWAFNGIGRQNRPVPLDRVRHAIGWSLSGPFAASLELGCRMIDAIYADPHLHPFSFPTTLRDSGILGADDGCKLGASGNRAPVC